MAPALHVHVATPMMMPEAFPPPSQSSAVTQRVWDFVIIGAGPAGAMAAHELARHNVSVLLLDQAEFPRRKVCGGCLSHRALDELEGAGLGDLPFQLGAKPLHAVRITAAGRSVRISIPLGASLSRERFDFALIEEAQKEGAVFLSRTKGILREAGQNFVRVQILQHKQESEVHGRIVLVSDGLLGSSLGNAIGRDTGIAADSLLGISTSMGNNAGSHEEGIITMACGQNGYVGIAKREDNKLEIAAAIRPGFLKSAGTPGQCVATILDEAGVQVPGNFTDVSWQGAPAFPRRHRVLAGQRYFVLGDASGFVEPFTGEGMYWAMLQARALVKLLHSQKFAWENDFPRQWQTLHQQLLRSQMQLCGLLAGMLRYPAFCRMAIATAQRAPWLVAPLVRYIHGA